MCFIAVLPKLLFIIYSQISYILISTIDRVDNDGAAQQHEQPEDGEHGLGEAEAGTDLGLGRGPIYLYFLVSGDADTRVAR